MPVSKQVGDMKNRKRRICIWNTQKNVVSGGTLSLEHHLKRLFEIDFYELESLDDPKFFPCDLLVIYAEYIEDENFETWLENLKNKIQTQGKIWVPSLIFSKLGFSSANFLLPNMSGSNWYFDIIHPDHINSIPIRVANLLRINDHLWELIRYDQELQKIGGRVAELEQKLESMTKK